MRAKPVTQEMPRWCCVWFLRVLPSPRATNFHVAESRRRFYFVQHEIQLRAEVDNKRKEIIPTCHTTFVAQQAARKVWMKCRIAAIQMKALGISQNANIHWHVTVKRTKISIWYLTCDWMLYIFDAEKSYSLSGTWGKKTKQFKLKIQKQKTFFYGCEEKSINL